MGRGRAFSEGRGRAGPAGVAVTGGCRVTAGNRPRCGPRSEPPLARAARLIPHPRVRGWGLRAVPAPRLAAPVICGSREGNNGSLLREAGARSAPRPALAGWRVAVPAAWAGPGLGWACQGLMELPEQGSGSDGLSVRSAGPQTALKLSQEGAGLSHGGVFLIVEL